MRYNKQAKGTHTRHTSPGSPKSDSCNASSSLHILQKRLTQSGKRNLSIARQSMRCIECNLIS